MEEMNNEELVIETPVVEAAPVVEEAPVAVEENNPVEDTVVETPIVIEEPKIEQEVIGTPSYNGGSDSVQTIGLVGDGAIGATTAPRPAKKPSVGKKAPSKDDSVAVYSTKNVTWAEVGKVYRGYNIVSKDAAEKWLTRSHVRLATPEEVAKEFGK